MRSSSLLFNSTFQYREQYLARPSSHAEQKRKRKLKDRSQGLGGVSLRGFWPLAACGGADSRGFLIGGSRARSLLRIWSLGKSGLIRVPHEQRHRVVVRLHLFCFLQHRKGEFSIWDTNPLHFPIRHSRFPQPPAEQSGSLGCACHTIHHFSDPPFLNVHRALRHPHHNLSSLSAAF